MEEPGRGECEAEAGLKSEEVSLELVKSEVPLIHIRKQVS